MRRLTRKSERGYNLIEVIIAMAMLGGVILSIVGLFAVSRKQVHSGKQMTQATAAATNVMEDIQGMSASTIYSAFNITDAELAAVDIDPDDEYPGTDYDEYENSVTRNTDDITAETDPNDILQRWKNTLENKAADAAADEEAAGPKRFNDGQIHLVLTPVEPPDGAAATFANAALTRVRIVVRWKEDLRPRQVVLDTVKVN